MTDYLKRDDVREAYLNELIELLKIPTISANGDQAPLREAVDWLVERMEKAGISTRVIETEGFPVIYGEAKGRSDRTVLFYNHYDVQPAEPYELWHSDPFDPTIRDGFLFARGVDDNKGALMSRIHAVESLLKTHGELPVNVKFLIEGEEESGSRNLGPVVDANRELLAADACIWENARRDDAGNPTITLGSKGMYSFELHVKVADADSHSGKANIYPNALWRLTWALSTLKGPDDRVLVPGFYDNVAELGEADEQLCRTTPANGAAQAGKLGLSELLPGNDDTAVNQALFYSPSMNIQGISGGYTGPGHKTVNPASAFARLECRLVRNQDPEDIGAKIKAHLEQQGFDDIQVVSTKAGAWPMRTSVDDPFVELVCQAGRDVYGKDVVILPTSPGTGPRFVFRHVPDMPIVAIGVGHADSRAHAPNENISIEDQFLTTQHVANILDRFSKYGN